MIDQSCKSSSQVFSIRTKTIHLVSGPSSGCDFCRRRRLGSSAVQADSLGKPPDTSEGGASGEITSGAMGSSTPGAVLSFFFFFGFSVFSGSSTSTCFFFSSFFSFLLSASSFSWCFSSSCCVSSFLSFFFFFVSGASHVSQDALGVVHKDLSRPGRPPHPLSRNHV